MATRRTLLVPVFLRIALLIAGVTLMALAVVLKDRDGPLHYAGMLLLIPVLLWTSIEQWREAQRRLQREQPDDPAPRDTP